MPLIMVSRDEWGAAPPAKEVQALPSPLMKVIMTKTRTGPCFNDEECKSHLRQLQKFHIDNGLEDIPYNFVVTPDCKVYECRGWYKVSPTPKERPELRNKSLVIAHIGDFPEMAIERRLMTRATVDLIDYGIMNDKLIAWEHDFMDMYSYIDSTGFQFESQNDPALLK